MKATRGPRLATVGLAIATAVAFGVSCQNGAQPKANSGALAPVDPVRRGCALPKKILVRIRRGHDPVRSEDVTFVPRQPNFVGTFNLTSHSGPWDYVQRVPLVLYGPGHIRAAGERVRRHVTLADVATTMGRLTKVSLPGRDGQPLEEALTASSGAPPRLILVIVWDGAGRNVLAAHPGRWPHLRALERAGTSYANATVGSSPSVTSAIHATLGTGAFPRSHGITGNELRTKGNRLRPSFAGATARGLRLTTFADEIDRALGNEPEVGLLGWKGWHIGMMGHGSAIEGADRDELALVKYDNNRIHVFGNRSFYKVPSHLETRSDLQAHLQEVDRADGKLDEHWLGHDISLDSGITWTTYGNPAWVDFEADLVRAMLEEKPYGRDAIPDFLFVNFKMIDLVGHQWGATSPEAGGVLTALDKALAGVVDYLDREIKDYVLVLTADHGHASLPKEIGAWPISQTELGNDIDARFGVPPSSDLLQASPAFGLYLDPRMMQEIDVDAREVASFLNGYTISDNWSGDELPAGYGSRGDERVFSAAFAKPQLREVVKCAFGEQPSN